jgi:Domain of unknown function (DUF4388)
MAFTGNIADWSLADILQVVASERKSGSLTLAHPQGGSIEMEFKEGQIVGARDRAGGGKGSGFLAFMQETGRISHEQARAVHQMMKESGEPELAAIDRAGFLRQPGNDNAFAAYCQELVYRALTWREGDYHFAAAGSRGVKAAAPGEPRTHGLGIEALLLEAMRRIDESPRIEHIVQPETVFQPGDVSGAASSGLGRREQTLLNLVDGSRDVRTLGRMAHLTEFDAQELLFNLHEAGLIRARTGSHRDPMVFDLVEDGSVLTAAGRLLRLVIILVAVAISLGIRWRALELTATVASAPDPRAVEIERFARELFIQHTGREPEGRGELERAGLLVPEPYFTAPAVAEEAPADDELTSATD